MLITPMRRKKGWMKLRDEFSVLWIPKKMKVCFLEKLFAIIILYGLILENLSKKRCSKKGFMKAAAFSAELSL